MGSWGGVLVELTRVWSRHRDCMSTRTRPRVASFAAPPARLPLFVFVWVVLCFSSCWGKLTKALPLVWWIHLLPSNGTRHRPPPALGAVGCPWRCVWAPCCVGGDERAAERKKARFAPLALSRPNQLADGLSVDLPPFGSAAVPPLWRPAHKAFGRPIDPYPKARPRSIARRRLPGRTSDGACSLLVLGPNRRSQRGLGFSARPPPRRERGHPKCTKAHLSYPHHPSHTHQPQQQAGRPAGTPPSQPRRHDARDGVIGCRRGRPPASVPWCV